jgi:siroheme synthase-like protein
MADDAPPPGGIPLLVHPSRLRVLCVGGGDVAAAKLSGLLEGGSHVRVVAPHVCERIRDVADRGNLQWIPRSYVAGDVGDAHLVIAGTDAAEVNAAVAADADAAGRMCVRVDDGRAGTAAMMGAVHRGPLVLGVATTGAAPALTRMIRRELADRYGPEHAELAALAGEIRSDERVVTALAAVDAGERRARWRALYGPDILGHIRAGRLDQAKEAAYACLLSSSD